MVSRRPRLLLAVTVLLTLAALVPAARFRVETDLSALLPEGAPGAEDYRDLPAHLRRLREGLRPRPLARRQAGGLRGPDRRRRASWPSSCGTARRWRRRASGLTEEDERFFFTYVAPRMPLLVHGPDWKEDLARRLEPAAIHARVAQMRQALRSPAGAIAAPLFAADPLGLSEGLLGAAATSLPIDPLSGGFVSRGGDAALVIVTPARAGDRPRGRPGAAGRPRPGLRRGAPRLAGVPLDFKARGRARSTPPRTRRCCAAT